MSKQYYKTIFSNICQFRLKYLNFFIFHNRIRLQQCEQYFNRYVIVQNKFKLQFSHDFRKKVRFQISNFDYIELIKKITSIHCCFKK